MTIEEKQIEEFKNKYPYLAEKGCDDIIIFFQKSQQEIREDERKKIKEKIEKLREDSPDNVEHSDYDLLVQQWANRNDVLGEVLEILG